MRRISALIFAIISLCLCGCGGNNESQSEENQLGVGDALYYYDYKKLYRVTDEQTGTANIWANAGNYCSAGKILGFRNQKDLTVGETLGAIFGNQVDNYCYAVIKNCAIDNAIVWQSLWMNESFTFTKSDVTTVSATTAIKEGFQSGFSVGLKEKFEGSASWNYEKTSSSTVSYANTVTYEKSFDETKYDTENYDYCYAILANVVKLDIYKISTKLVWFQQKYEAIYDHSEIILADNAGFTIQRLYRERRF